MKQKLIVPNIKTLLICIGLLVNHLTYSQDLQSAPSLQLGLSGINFTKGNLDPELIAEIIAEKQKEVKVKLVKNMLLNKLGVDNGLFYAYIDNSIEIITSEKDEDTRVKNLLENSVNISFVVGYADYYIRTLKQGSPQWKSLRKLALLYGIDNNVFETKKLSLKDFTKINYKEIDNTGDGKEPSKSVEASKNEFVSVLIDLFSEQIRQNEQFKALGILRTNYLQNYLSMNAYLSLKDEDVNHKVSSFFYANTSRIDTLLYGKDSQRSIKLFDLMKQHIDKGKPFALSADEESFVNKYYNDLVVYVSVIPDDEDEKITKYKEIVKSESYRKYSLYSSFKLDLLSEKDSSEIYEKQKEFLRNYQKARNSFIKGYGPLIKVSFADTVFNQVKENLDVYVKYYGLIKSLTTKGTDWEKSLIAISNNFTACGNIKNINDTLLINYSLALAEIKNLNNVSTEDIERLNTVNSFLGKIRFVSLNRYEYMQEYEKNIKPAFEHLGKYSSKFIILNNSIFDIINCTDTVVKNDLSKVNINPKLSFLNVFTKIDEFDKVATYTDFLNQLSDAGDIFSDEEMRKSINKIISFVRSYIKMGEDVSGNKVLNLDVEGFLISLRKIPYNKYNPLEFHFTVGANTTAFSKPLVTDKNDTLRNYSFIGEKIGIKFKLWDWKYIKSFSKGETFTYWSPFHYGTYERTAPPKEPAISNVHLLAYGSGIIYNLINTGTTKDFNSPVVGVGVGITFFNDLDFNVTYGKPILKNKAFADTSIPTFINFGFDIQFVEYFERLNKKRKNAQIQNKLVKASAKK